MAPLIAFGRKIVVGFCVALATTDATTANNNRGGASTTAGGLSAGSPGSGTLSEHAGSDTRSSSNGCIEGDGDGEGDSDCSGSGEQNAERNRAWTLSSVAADLEELADRVNDALVAADADLDAERTALLGSTSSSSPATRSSGRSGQTTGTLCEQKYSSGSSTGDDQGESLSSPDNGVLVTPTSKDSGATTNQGAEESTPTSPSAPEGERVETAVDVEVAEVCGEGEHRRTCNKGEECCNSSCGICAPKGQSCLQIACGGLTRGGGSPQVAYMLSTHSLVVFVPESITSSRR